jgi:hypothetical protein
MFSVCAAFVPSLQKTYQFVKKVEIRTSEISVPQSVQRLATGRTTDGSEFESRYDQEFSLLHIIHPTSYPIGTGGYFPRVKEVGA